MKRAKDKPVHRCEYQMARGFMGIMGIFYCGKPAKYIKYGPYLDYSAFKHLCGIHANMLKKRGIKVRAI